MNKKEHEREANIEKKYTANDMFAAFKHGKNHEQSTHEGDIATVSLPERNRPFWEWLKLKDESVSPLCEEPHGLQGDQP